MRYLLPFILLLSLYGCGPEAPASTYNPLAVKEVYDESEYQDTSLMDSILYDRLLGALVGSAIGDAMGAPTEMWSQWDIREAYGHVDSLDLVLREPSPEGPWDYNLPPGAGTDDTRWKALMVEFVVAESELRRAGNPLSLQPNQFASHLNTHYQESIARLKATEGVAPEPFEDNMRRLTWLQEWARVTRAYAKGDIDEYRDALARFYGGEMSCAGMLYAPVVGMLYPGRPEVAYSNAYDLSLFDLGYARDITAMTAALTAAAFSPGAGADTLAFALRDVDPKGFFRSRLLGRVAYKQYEQARRIVRETQRMTQAEAEEMDLRFPDNYPYDNLQYARTIRAYQLLDKAKQDVAFHAGEVHLINLTAILFSELDFKLAMEFITNYGRDNDTVAAVTGAILGTIQGYSKLPRDQRELVVRVNREVLDTDLEALAWELKEAIVARRGE